MDASSRLHICIEWNEAINIDFETYVKDARNAQIYIQNFLNKYSESFYTLLSQQNFATVPIAL